MTGRFRLFERSFQTIEEAQYNTPTLEQNLGKFEQTDKFEQTWTNFALSFEITVKSQNIFHNRVRNLDHRFPIPKCHHCYCILCRVTL